MVPNHKELFLGAEDADDLATLSALCQDAGVLVGEMAYVPEQHRFALMMARFCWEDEPRTKRRGLLFRKQLTDEPYTRVRSGLHFDTVLKVTRDGFDQADKARVLDLLAIDAPADDQILLRFAEGATVRLDVEVIDAHLRDISQPWATPIKPHHEDES